MLTVHHLGRSQSQRIVWLCEELGIPYALKTYERDKQTLRSPPELKALHPLGAAPVIEDGQVKLAESGAIMEYIIGRHGGGRLALKPEDAAYPDFLYWLHFANGTLQPAMGRMMILARLNLAADNPVQAAMRGRLERALGLVEARLAGGAAWLAGEAFTAADIMIVFTLTTMRSFFPVDFAPYPAIRAYLRRVAVRPAYQRAMAKGDPEMKHFLV